MAFQTDGSAQVPISNLSNSEVSSFRPPINDLGPTQTSDETREIGEVDRMRKMEEGSRKVGFKRLPNEILDHIFSKFDCEAPSSAKLNDQPSFEITSSSNNTLKNCSLVCTRWRRVIIPVLYKHTCLVIRDPLLPTPIMRNEYYPMLNFVRVHKLKPVVKTFTLCIADKKPAGSVQAEEEGFRRNDFTDFFQKIFEQLDPFGFTICCNPMTLGALTSCTVNSTDAWCFKMPYHILHLNRPEIDPPPSPKLQPGRPTSRYPSARPRPPLRPSPLFESRQWRSLLLNEGSFIEAYKTYEFFQKQPPSILTDLIVSHPNIGTHTKLLPPTIRDLSYIGLFPTSQHFHQLASNLPRLDRFYTQFVPRNDVLQDPDAMSHLDTGDLWMERNSCYAFVMRELFSAPPAGNFVFLKEFESGDHADEDAWEMAVEYVKRAGRGWKIERRGVFVKDMEAARRWEEMERAAQSSHGGSEQAPPSLLSVPQDLDRDNP